MKTTVRELRNKTIEELCIEHNRKQQQIKQTPNCENFLGPRYKYIYYSQTGMKYPQNNIMFSSDSIK